MQTRNPNVPTSSPRQAQTCTQATASSSAASTTVGNIAQPASRGPNNTSPTQTTSPNSQIPPHYIPKAHERVLFGIQARGQREFVELEKIDLAGPYNDPTFFRALQAAYRKHRSLMQTLFLSPYRFRFCRFVKVRLSTYCNTISLTLRSSGSSTLAIFSPTARVSQTITGTSTTMNTCPGQAQFLQVLISPQESSRYALALATRSPASGQVFLPGTSVTAYLTMPT